jgi:hypothetical protein
MMLFTDDELLCFNSITNGPAPFRIKIKQTRGSEADIVARTKERLRERQLLDDQNHLTTAGGMIVRYYEEYRNSNHYLIINEMSVAIIAKRRCIVVYPADGGYMMGSMDTAKVMAAAVHECTFLQASRSSATAPPIDASGFAAAGSPGQWAPADWEAVSAYVKENAVGHLIINEIKERDATKSRLIYWTKERAYLYNIERQRQKEVNPPQLYQELLKLFKLWELREEVAGGLS